MRIAIKGTVYPSSQVWVNDIYMGEVISRENDQWQMNEDGPICITRLGAIREYAKLIFETYRSKELSNA